MLTALTRSNGADLTLPALLLVSLLVLSLTGCGYRPLGSTVAPGTARPTIKVHIFENRAHEFGLEGIFNQALIDWLQESRRVEVVFGDSPADYLIDGTIERIEFPGTAFDIHDAPTGLKAVVDLSWRISRTDGGKSVLQRHERREAGYSVAAQPAMTRTNRVKALKTMAGEVAEQVYIELGHLVTEN